MNKICAIIVVIFAMKPSVAQDSRKMESLFSINTGQLLNKAGVANIVRIFEKSSANMSTQERNEMQQSIARLYSSGFDMNKKSWQVSYTANLQPGNLYILNEDYRPAQKILIVPVQNKQVVQEQINNLSRIANKYKKDGKPVDYFRLVGNHLVSGFDDRLLVLTDDALYCTNIPLKYNYLTREDKFGKFLRADTVRSNARIDYSRKLNEEKSNKKAAKKLEVDRVGPDGKIQRVYFYKDPIEQLREKVQSMDAGDGEIRVDTSIVRVDTTVVEVTDSPARAEYAVRDTVENFEFINDSVSVTEYYLRYSSQERAKRELEAEERKKIDYDAGVQRFLSTFNTLLPGAVDANIHQLLKTSSDDITIYKPKEENSLSSPGLLEKVGLFTQIPKTDYKPSQLVSFNFNNGAIAIDVSYNCCDTGSFSLKEIYKPVSNFWPAELGNGELGYFRFNFNIEKFLTVLPSIPSPKNGNAVKFQKEVEEVNKFADGEVVASIVPTMSKRHNRPTPRLLVALKLKNAKLAVAYMNKMAAEKPAFTRNYHFDPAGRYLIFDTENNSTVKPAEGTSPQDLSVGNFGDMQIDIRKLIDKMTTDEKKQSDKMYDDVSKFLGKFKMVNTQSEDGKFFAKIQIDMGEKNENALSSLLAFLLNNESAFGLKSLKKLMR